MTVVSTIQGLRLDLDQDAWDIKVQLTRDVVVHPKGDPESSANALFRLHTGNLYEIAESVMRRMVRPPAQPERSQTTVNDRVALTFFWTDGVLDIETSFIGFDATRVVEMVYAARTPEERQILSQSIRVAWD